MLKNDVARNKIITATLFLFIMMAALLVSSAIGMITELAGAMNQFFQAAEAPHFVQMHAGELDQQQIDAFSTQNPLVKRQQTVEMINIDNSHLYFGASGEAEKNSVMEVSFVVQNQQFDFLLDQENQPVATAPGNVGIPIHYRQRFDLEIGDTLRIGNDSFSMELVISEFIRDVQMNPSVVSSKRFLINEADWQQLKVGGIGQKEYLVEFLLHDASQEGVFGQQYLQEDLPQKGPAVTYRLIKMVNALTDGLVAMVMIMVSLLLIVIALICLRFTMLATLEEDYREIGVMKAIGIHPKDIRRLYMAKYMMMAIAASGAGYLVSFWVHPLLTGNISAYMGSFRQTILHRLIPLAGVLLVTAIVILFCRRVLKRFTAITAVEALRLGRSPDLGSSSRILPLRKNRILETNIFLGVRDIAGRIRMFGVLGIVLILCSFILIVPINFLNTVNSPTFVNYMGAGRSDLRIDLRQTENIDERYNEMLTELRQDQDIETYAVFITSQYTYHDKDDIAEKITIETGDFTKFPLTYMEGRAPETESEIALSYLNFRELEKQVGDTLILSVGDDEQVLTVSGIYQDVTNGGKTAKAILPHDPQSVQWIVVNLDMKPGVILSTKMEAYSQAFYPAKVVGMDDYVYQTFGETIAQLQKITLLAGVVAVIIAMLMTALFFKMLLTKDAANIAVMQMLGFSTRQIRLQYMTRALVMVGAGIMLGTLAAATLGQQLISLLGSFSGASEIQFIVDPVIAYILCPLLLTAAVLGTTWVSSRSIHQNSSLIMAAE